MLTSGVPGSLSGVPSPSLSWIVFGFLGNIRGSKWCLQGFEVSQVGQKVVARGDPRIQGKEALVVKATCSKFGQKFQYFFELCSLSFIYSFFFIFQNRFQDPWRFQNSTQRLPDVITHKSEHCCFNEAHPLWIET